jgi:hypothetical protein
MRYTKDVTRIMTKNMEELLWRGDSLDRKLHSISYSCDRSKVAYVMLGLSSPTSRCFLLLAYMTGHHMILSIFCCITLDGIIRYDVLLTTSPAGMSHLSTSLRSESEKYRKAARKINVDAMIRQYAPVAAIAFILIILLWWRFS